MNDVADRERVQCAPPPVVGRVVVAVLVVVLAGCASQPRSRDADAVAPVTSSSALAYIQRLDEQARQQDREGRLADEAMSLELLGVLLRDDPIIDARRRNLGERIATATQDHLRRAADAWKRGQTDLATAQFLAALALSPDNETAANALRTMEVDRNKRVLAAKQRVQKAKAPEPAPGD